MTKPAFRRACLAIDLALANLGETNPRRRVERKVKRWVEDYEIVARLKADPMFERYCCKMARAMTDSGTKMTAVQVARLAYEVE